jgi:hypothetical protein
VHRRAPAGAGQWEIRYFPIAGAQGILAILGTITVLVSANETSIAIPEKLMALRDRQRAQIGRRTAITTRHRSLLA